MDDAMLQQRLAYAIREAMKRRGIKSSRELARRMDRDPTTVNRWVSGQSVPNALVVGPLAEALGVKIEYLVNPPAVPSYPLEEYLIPDDVVRRADELARGAVDAERQRLETEAEEARRVAEGKTSARRARRPA